jgi:parvulin-like peptidyl-prolyl isomerase
VHRHFLSLCLFALVMLMTACASSEAPVNANPPPNDLIIPTIAPGQMPTDSAGLPLVATVNGQGIRLSEFERALARTEQQQLTAADPSALRASVLNTLIEEVLVGQEASRQQVEVTDATVDAEVTASVQLAGGVDAWQQWLAANLYTDAEYRNAVRTSLIYTRMIESVTASLNGNVPHVHARHILVATQAEANDILAQLQNGADFATLAARSLDMTTRELGGDLGWFTQDELIDPSLGTIAFSLEPMQIAGPIQTTLGYHIIQTLERGDLPVPEERRAQLAQKQFETWLSSLAAGATIERFI